MCGEILRPTVALDVEGVWSRKTICADRDGRRLMLVIGSPARLCPNTGLQVTG